MSDQRTDQPKDDPGLDELIRHWRQTAGNIQIPPSLSALNDPAGPASPLSLKATSYSIRVRDSRLYSPSALACLYLPAHLAEILFITATCPTYGSEISLTVTPTGVSASDPAGCVLSLVLPGEKDGQAKELMRFFSSSQAAAIWLVPYPDVLILDIHQAWRLAMGLYADLAPTAPIEDRKQS